ncbi:restriction endonuclease subunit S [Pontibacter flavimaris]|uniref:restriction endonuclease subunit S n=1 Tax=Pontibacter flavimaris TaxID=1797110 RepID=UPI00093FED1F|nr:restriction endonuclease subunit S [Pontibacter flavimaris]
MERELPEGWEVVNLPEVVYFQEGPGLRKFQYRDSGIPFLNIRTLSNERVDTSLCGFLDQDEVDQKYQHFLLNEGDIICSTSGTIGKTAIIQEVDLPLMLNTSIVRFRSLQDDVVTRQFVYYFLKSDWFHEQADEYSTGTAQRNIGPSHLQRFAFPLPPLAEQKRIVAKLDEAFQHLDTLKAKLERIPELLKNFRRAVMIDKLPQAILAKAFRGELVPQDHNDEPASVLLEKIKAAKAAAAKGKKTKGGKQAELVL